MASPSEAHAEALADAAAATVRLVLAAVAWEDSLDRLGAITKAEKEVSCG